MQNQTSTANYVNETPKYKPTRDLAAVFDAKEPKQEVSDQRLEPRESNNLFFDKILKSLETPKPGASLGLENASNNSKFRSRVDEVFAKKKENVSSLTNVQKLIINGSRKTKFSRYAQNFSNFGSRAASPEKKYASLKTPMGVAKTKLGGYLMSKRRAKNMSEMDIITSAMPERHQSKMSETQQMIHGLDPRNDSVGQSGHQGSRRGLTAKAVPKFGFDEKENYHSGTAHNLRANIDNPYMEDNQFNYNSRGNLNDDLRELWQDDSESTSLYLGKKRMNPPGYFENSQLMAPSLRELRQDKHAFEPLRSEEERYSHHHHQHHQHLHPHPPVLEPRSMNYWDKPVREEPDLYCIGRKKRKNRLSGIRSTRPERSSGYSSNNRSTYFGDDSFLNSRTKTSRLASLFAVPGELPMKSLKIEDSGLKLPGGFEKERIKLRKRYEREARQLMMRARNHKMKTKKFKKPSERVLPGRGAARPPVIKEGDWLCPNTNCSNINWSKRTRCNLCGQVRPHMSVVKKRPYMVTKLYEANTWSCPKCKNIINADHTFCGICGTNRTKDIEQGLEQVKRHFAQKKKKLMALNRASKVNKNHQKVLRKEPHQDSLLASAKIAPSLPILNDPYNNNHNLLELNLKRNFGGEGYLKGNDWYQSTNKKNQF